MLLKASAPGSLMLLGEYAVLHHYPALVCAINQRLTIELRPRDDEQLCLVSDRYGRHETCLSLLSAPKPFEFVLETVKHFKLQLRTGFDLSIYAGFSDQVGFGSSAALVAALLAAFNHWLQLNLSLLQMVQHGRQIVRAVQQGRGSGADVAASLYGGVLAYRVSPLIVQSFDSTYPLVACYAGFKTKTALAIQHVERAFVSYPALFSTLIRGIGECALSGIEALNQHDWVNMGKLFRVQQGLMESLSVSLPILQQLIMQLNQLPNMLGAKISGAGLGDCVIGLGHAHPNHFSSVSGSIYIPVEMSQKGVICEQYG